MTEPATDDTVPADAPEDASEEPQEDREGDGKLTAARREAAGYRTQLREVEAERDKLRESVAGFRRRDVEAIAATPTANGTALASGADLWVGGVTVEDCLDEDGAVDENRVRENVVRLLATRPHWRRPAGDVGQGPRNQVKTSPSWADALKAR